LNGAPEPVPLGPELPDVRILLVDDREESRIIIGSYLKDIGCQNTDTAASGEQALELLRAAVEEEKPYGLCLIDMIMPFMDGWRLAAEINQDPSINETRLILMVPHGLLGADAKMTLLKWFNAYINKPIKRKDLTEIIAQVLSGPPVDLEAASEDEGPFLSEKVQSKGIFTDTPHSEASVPAPAAGKPAGRPLVLIAEDHPVNQKLFAIILEKLECDFTLADDGLDALEKTGTFPVDLIFMDIQMPRMNGYEAAQHLRERGFTNPIIAVTASALPDELAQCLKAGINDILFKPFKRPDVEELLRKWLPSPGTNEGGAQPAAESGGNAGGAPDFGAQGPGRGLLAKAALRSRPVDTESGEPFPAPRSGPLVPEPLPADLGESETYPDVGTAPIPSPLPVPTAAPVRVTGPQPRGTAPVQVAPVRVSGAAPAAPVSVTKAPVFNSRELLDTFLNDAETIKPLIGRFLERAEDQIACLSGMAQQEAWEEGRRIAHTIKGSALTLSGQELGQAAARLELAFKTRTRHEIQAGIPPLMEAFARFKTEAKLFIGERV
jgi:CheY-like chemotaxis protein